MLKKFTAVFFAVFLFALGEAGATEYNPFSLNYFHINTGFESEVYGRYGNTDYNFFYQLRDVTGVDYSDRNKVGGSQWFATVYENYYYHFRDEIDNPDGTLNIYRRTMGGEIPEITFRTVGDILDGFNFIFAEEPQPYESYWRRFIGTGVYDPYPDPIESVCIVTSNGMGDFNVDFGNPYAREFPFWWSWSTAASETAGERWWQRHVDWQDMVYPTTEPIAYIFSSPDIYSRSPNYDYVKAYTISRDVSSDIAGIKDMSNNVVFTISGDKSGYHEFYNTESTLVYSVSGDKVFNAAGNLIYTIETDFNGTDLYICELRNVNESITVEGFQDDYNVTVQPSSEQAVSSGNSLSAGVRFMGDGSTYGSRLGYLTFRQRASFASGYSNYKQFTSIPLVIANVAEGNAEVEPLIFDMRIYDTDNATLVNRRKFKWDVQSKMTQDLGDIFIPVPQNIADQNDNPIVLNLETRITNRSGTRYELFRYDGIGSNENVVYRDDYANIMPDHWKYDLTRDSYGTLPDYFLLDAKSQIAPGLVTVYKNNIGEGYSTMTTGNIITDSFRLYEYRNAVPKNLSLRHRSIKGMTIPAANGAPQTRAGNTGEVSSIQAFNMNFVNDDVNSSVLIRLENMIHKVPAIIPIEILTAISPVTPLRPENNTGTDTINSFQVNLDVPDGFVFYELIDEAEESENNEEEDEIDESSVSASAITYSSDKAAILPLKVRLTIPKNSTFIKDSWEDLNNALDQESIFKIFSDLASVYVRVSNTVASDGSVDLFKALNTAENRGGVQGKKAKDFVNVVVNDEKDELYVDFIVFIADATAPDSRQNVNPERPIVSAFIYTFEDDDVPYILIGDGSVDKAWNLTFYVAAPDTAATRTSSTTQNEGQEVSESSSGGTCSTGTFGILGWAFLISALKKSR